MLGMEFWLFEIVTVIIAHMGSVVVGTNQILLTITR
jgi:Na+-driven multidrug efflux pump